MAGTWGEDGGGLVPAQTHVNGTFAPHTIALSDAPIAVWQGAHQRGQTGLHAQRGSSATLLWEVPALPDFSSSRFSDLTGLEATARTQQIAQAQAQFLQALIAHGPQVGCSLRYLKEAGSERIRLFFIVRVSAGTDDDALIQAELLQQAVESSMPRGYTLTRKDTRDPLMRNVVAPRAKEYSELLKIEQWEEAWHDPQRTGFRLWYGVQGLPSNSANDMLAFCQALVRLPGSFLFDVTLLPTAPLTPIEREELQTWSHLADRYSRDRRETIDIPGGLYSKPSRQTIEIQADPKAESFKRVYEGLIQSFDYSRERALLYAIRVLSLDDVSDATGALRLFASYALQPGAPYYTATASYGTPELEKAIRSVHLSYVTPAICNPHWSLPDAPETLRRLHRMTSVAEIAPLFRFPIPGKEGCPGFPLDGGFATGDASRKEASTGIHIGRHFEQGRELQETASISLQDLCKHALIVGVPGSGKTSLSFSLLVQLWRNQEIPWLVLEPAKTEYRGLLDVDGVGEDLLVFTVGNERIAPLRLNLLEILDGVSVSEHLAAVKTCFQGAFSLPDPLPMLLERALEEVYADKGWSLFGEGGDDPLLEPPTLQDLYLKALEVAERSRYQGEVAGNIRAMLETRLGSLLKGPKGRCFGARKSVPIELLMERPVVLELDALSEDEKALAMMAILIFVRERAISTRRSGAKLTHVCLVEEAHNLLGSDAGAGGNREGGDAKGVAVRYFTRMLAEMRALGEGLIIADQLPTALASEVVKNTNVKVMHRLTAADDREVLGRAMVLSEGQKEQAATLPAGMGFAFQEGWPTARLVKEPNIKLDLGIEEPPDRRVVQEKMAAFFSGERVKDAYLPYKSCHAVCDRCDPLIRERRERWAQSRLPVIEEELKRDPDGEADAIALIEYSDGLELPPDARVESACAMAHFLELIQPQVGMLAQGRGNRR